MQWITNMASHEVGCIRFCRGPVVFARSHLTILKTKHSVRGGDLHWKNSILYIDDGKS